MTQATLFPALYPHEPAARDTDTSRAAAESIRDRAEMLREKALALFDRYEMTADECAAKLNEPILSIRPRVTELGKLGLIEDTGKRRFNISGRKAIVWRKTNAAE